MTGLSIKMISAAENGHKAMRPENIVKICNCLSISTDYLLKGTDTTLNSLAGENRLSLLSVKQRLALERIVDDFFTAFD
jgi:transcriptional regulator with XRE-family HTH domain